jgi:hypothetical protein
LALGSDRVGVMTVTVFITSNRYFPHPVVFLAPPTNSAQGVFDMCGAAVAHPAWGEVLGLLCPDLGRVAQVDTVVMDALELGVERRPALFVASGSAAELLRGEEA